MNKIGIIISLEKYSDSLVGLPAVKYANNDAHIIERIFLEKFEIPKDNIFKFINEEGTLENCGLEGSIGYILSNLESDTTVFFYYVGHGFYSKGDNYLTVYDTSNIDLINTSLSIQNVFMELFRKSNANRLIAFIDACAEGIEEEGIRFINGRGIGTASAHDESIIDYAIFFSCSPNEKSYSSDVLHHGFWTHYLTEAILKDANEAKNNSGNISVKSLQDYLREMVSDSVKSELNKKQTPYYLMATDEDIVLVDAKLQKSFGQQIKELDEKFQDRCFLINLYTDYYDEEYSIIGNYNMLQEVCGNVADLLPENWYEVFRELAYYVKMIDDNKEIFIPYKEQLEVIDRIKKFIDSIDTNESTYYDR